MGDEEGIFRTAVSSRGPFGVNNGRFLSYCSRAHTVGASNSAASGPKVSPTTPAHATADFVSKNGRFWAVFRTIVLKAHDDRWFVQ